ncbi:hypothetical protein BJ912DRAFT_1049226 [Pholiota molesta]|nr:hypothetical protein BJ912DRAFT_1049226 [Pholiota molesta]
MADFDIESLIHVEQSFYDAGYADGFAHGRIHGLIEGRALGREKGFEIWEELGFYEGFARTWRAVLDHQGRGDDRAAQHIRLILASIAQFPRVNPSSAPPSSVGGPAVAVEAGPNAQPDPELDITQLLRQIRSRYKVLCASLGVRPRLRTAAGPRTRGGAGVDEEMAHGAGQRTGVCDPRVEARQRDGREDAGDEPGSELLRLGVGASGKGCAYHAAWSLAILICTACGLDSTWRRCLLLASLSDADACSCSSSVIPLGLDYDRGVLPPTPRARTRAAPNHILPSYALYHPPGYHRGINENHHQQYRRVLTFLRGFALPRHIPPIRAGHAHHPQTDPRRLRGNTGRASVLGGRQRTGPTVHGCMTSIVPVALPSALPESMKVTHAAMELAPTYVYRIGVNPSDVRTAFWGQMPSRVASLLLCENPVHIIAAPEHTA